MYIRFKGSKEISKAFILYFLFLSILLLNKHAFLSSVGVHPYFSATTFLLVTSGSFYLIGLVIESRLLETAGLQSDRRNGELEPAHQSSYLPFRTLYSITLFESILFISFALIFIILRVVLWVKSQQDVDCMIKLEIGFLPWMCKVGDFLFTSRFSYRTVTEALQSGNSFQIVVMIHVSHTTHICFSTPNNWINLHRITSTLLDALWISYLVNLLRAVGTKKDGLRTSMNYFAVVALLGACSLSIINFIYFLSSEQSAPLEAHLSGQYLGHLLHNSILLIFAITFSILLVLHFSASEYAILLVTAHIHAGLLVGRFSLEIVVYLVLFYISIYFLIFDKVEVSGLVSSRKKFIVLTGRNVLVVGLALSTPSYRVFTTKFRLSQHPIDTLVSAAQPIHQTWLSQASKSRTLGDAVKNYQIRYGRDPPPDFDKWYYYATSRNSVIIDEFDQIQADLRPFWSLSPEELRERVWQITSDHWNEIAILQIRNGSVDMGPNSDPTHRWMVEGVKLLIEAFVEHIPDMDLPLNLNDESRVAVPWEDMQVAMAKSLPTKPQNTTITSVWSKHRASGWRSQAEQMDTYTRFTEQSWKNSFSSFAAPTCNPRSLARRQPYWNARKLCKKCIEPHSLDLFISNWSLSADICHQPDLSRLHGFFLSPAAFKVTNVLVPLFSQSKVPGFSDIIYPSAWNYMEKAQYQPTDQKKDPPFPQKVNSLFWRGGTTEGYSMKGRWRGMARQRLVWLTNTKETLQSTPLLIPRLHGNGWWITDQIVDHDLLRLSNTSIVNKIDRCTQEDCLEQGEAFELAESIDFQGHWKYKFLFDLDGAGFSGRFIAFLRSRSLPFKSAIFREWYSSRITPWLHFVPLDIRLHDMYSTLLYFTGILREKNGRETQVGAHEREAVLIAEQGREWANKSLRKEDMEIYMFRLLLEWGRLTDNRRDLIGFTL